ncbi:MAG: helix-turn-helix domain-containing protein [Verrucomicrobiales bacterium]|nr:helix-turn-helix domain-containing protein [Verrucomicrobiales bacterium]
MKDEFKPELTDESLRIKEAAAILKVSPRTIWRMIADGQLTASRFRRCTRLLRSQVLGHLKGNGNVGCV